MCDVIWTRSGCKMDSAKSMFLNCIIIYDIIRNPIKILDPVYASYTLS